MLAISNDFPSTQLSSPPSLEVVTVSVSLIATSYHLLHGVSPQLNIILNLLITLPPLPLYLIQF